MNSYSWGSEGVRMAQLKAQGATDCGFEMRWQRHQPDAQLTTTSRVSDWTTAGNKATCLAGRLVGVGRGVIDYARRYLAICRRGPRATRAASAYSVGRRFRLPAAPRPIDRAPHCVYHKLLCAHAPTKRTEIHVGPACSQPTTPLYPPPRIYYKFTRRPRAARSPATPTVAVNVINLPMSPPSGPALIYCPLTDHHCLIEDE
uniref:Uncharacterized protein n=1 Tax=Plectus sambesii TaxID=2011161 RepID=A0A914VWG3_9BILA